MVFPFVSKVGLGACVGFLVLGTGACVMVVELGLFPLLDKARQNCGVLGVWLV